MATIDIFNLSPRDFNLQMQEEAMYRTPAELDELRREYRNRNSMAGKLMGLLAPEEGKRRSTFLPVDAPQGMSIFDALRSGQATPAVPQGLVDLITGGTRGVESAREYAQGVPPRADALNDALAMSGLAMTGGGLAASTLRPKKPSLPSAPKERGDMILNMLKEGDAANITDDMFDMGDSVKTTQLNQYLFENYDLPMDAESRAQRLFQMGYRREGMHGTSKETAGTTETPDILAFQPSTAGSYGRGVYVDPVRDGDIGVSRYYAEPRGREAGTSGTYYPLLTKGKLIEKGSYDDEYFQALDDVAKANPKESDQARATTEDAMNRLAEQRVSEQGFAGVGGAGEYTIFDPANIRSRSARADPRLAHLSNIMAANASKSTGLLTSSAADLRRQANIERFGYDPNETPEVDTSYRGGHQPAGPQDENPVRLDDVTISTTGEQAGYPSDFYSSQGQRQYAQGPRFADDEFGLSNQQSYRAIQAARGNPDAEVTIYRGVPNEESITSINAGDFVTLSPKYAELHASSGYGPRGEDAGKVISQKVKVKDVYFAGDDVNEFGYFPDTTAANASKSTGLLTTAASEAQDMAKRILELRAEGRASEVTDEMMAQADPQYMFANTPLPMDEASRMARAEAAGFEGDLFHGGKGGYDIMRTDAGTGKTSGTGAFLTPSNKLAETYSPVVDGSVYPLMSRSSAPIVNADMQNWNNIESPVYAFDPKTMDDIEVIDEYGRASTDDIAREARKISEAIEIQDVSDRGPRAWGMTQYPAVSNVRVEYNPANIRSRFARFDPEFAHLSNLSAANVSPLGGLLAQSGVSDKQAERIEEYLRRRGLLD